MDLVYIWYVYRCWSKILLSIICTPAHDLEVKVTDLEKFYVEVLRQSFKDLIDKGKFRQATGLFVAPAFAWAT